MSGIRIPRGTTSPTLLAAALLAALALSAIVLPAWVVGLAALALVGATVADAAFLRRLSAPRRTAPETLARGQPAELTVEAEGPYVRRPLVRQAVPPDLRLDPSQASAPLRGWLAASRRGRHTLPPAAARAAGPLGLAAAYLSGSGEHEIRVYPDLPSARRLALAVQRGAYREEGTRGRGPLGLGTEFEAVRDYSPDDDVRQVNWRATARLGRPMSNDYRLEQDRDVIAAIDAGRLMSAPVAGGTVLDAGLDATAALAAVADVLGDRFGALAFDSEVRRELRPRRAGGAAALHTLYDLEPSDADTDYPRAFRRLDAGKRAFVVVFTDLLDEVAARSLLEAAPVIARRHAVAVATVRDPELEAATATAPRTASGAYRAAIAVDVLRERRVVAARLQRHGVATIESDAAGLGAACVRAYMRAKSRARL